VYALFTLGSGIYPDVAFPRVVVIAERGEDSVENMLIGVTRPIEEAVNAVPGLARVRSKTIRGASELSLDFAPKTDMRDALAQTRARVASLLAELPEGVSTTIEQQTPSVFPVLSFNVSLDKTKAKGIVQDNADLQQWIIGDLKPRLSRLPDVFMVTVQGSQTRQITVEPDPLRLAAANLSLTQLAQAIKESNQVKAVGLLERDYKQFQVLASGELHGVDDLAAIPILSKSGKTLHLRDVARVYLGLSDRTVIVTGNGEDGVVVSLFMRYGGKITELSGRVAAELKRAAPSLPPGVSITPVYDQADLVRESLGGVRDAMILGMLLAVAVLWIFLGSWRFTLIAGITIPIAVLGTFAFMDLLGQSLNLMSLGGIAVAVGLIIDDAIVVVENIARRMKIGANRARTVIEATGEIFGAVVGSSLTTVVVFLPLVLLEGIVGQFFNAMAAALAIGIIVSMVVSLTLTPIISAGGLGPRAGESTGRKWMEAIADRYERAIRGLLAKPLGTAVCMLILALIGGLLVARQSTGFLPSMDEGGFVLDYLMPDGTSLSETDANCRKIEMILSRTPEIRSFSRRTGAELGFFATPQNTGDFLAGLKPPRERGRHTAEVIDELRGQIAKEIPQIRASFVQIMQDTINDLAGNPSPIEVKIFGNDYHVLRDVSVMAAKRMESVPGVVDIVNDISFDSPEITYQLDADAVSRAGLTASAAADQLRSALLGEEATQIRRSNYLAPVMVRYADSIRRDPTWLERLPIADGEGRIIPANAISRTVEKKNVCELARENQQPLVAIEANISGRDLGSAAAELQSKLDAIPLPAGVRIELGGLVQNQASAFRNLMIVLALSIGLVFLLLVMQFRSYRLPLVIFFTIPFSQIGALGALKLAGIELNISAFMGLIMLIGLVVKNGIILIEYTAQLRMENGLNRLDALATAGRVRLRPILMTSLTAIMALIPLALNLGSGAELQRPLAVAVIGGLSVSTFFTLIIIPTAYLLLGEPEHMRPKSEEEVTS
ncbi:efflux RND transporter permease subunit, partial [Candidatus Sumerlaeota bacterium]|nr:efflux RND transporter permease subunit [Candidatus Sumerlaeota bacterium]